MKTTKDKVNTIIGTINTTREQYTEHTERRGVRVQTGKTSISEKA